MSFTNTTVGVVYTGDGTTTTFAIPFYYVPDTGGTVTQIASIDPVTGASTPIVSGFTFTPSVKNPTQVVFAAPPVAGTKIQVSRLTAIQQGTTFSSTGPFPGKTLEKTYDKLVTIIQEVDRRAANKSFLNEGLDTSIPPLVGNAKKALVVNDTETALKWSTAASGGLPDAHAPWTMLDAGAGGIQFTETAPVIGSGVSQLTGGFLSYSGILDALAKIFRFVYTLPSASLSGTSSGTLFERGNTQTNPTLSVSITKQSDPILDVSFYDGSITGPNQIGATQTSGGGIPAGGVNTQVTAVAFGSNRTFWARVRDNGAGNGGTPQNRDVSVTYNFVYPYYRGAGAAGLGAAVAGLTKVIQNNTPTSGLLAFSVTAGQKVYYSYPAAYAALTSILDQNGFEVIGSFTPTTVSITGLDATSQSYRVYEITSAIGVTGTYSYNFRQ
jgi:hypothetical protein